MKLFLAPYIHICYIHTYIHTYMYTKYAYIYIYVYKKYIYMYIKNGAIFSDETPDSFRSALKIVGANIEFHITCEIFANLQPPFDLNWCLSVSWGT